jgi:hypothetical protein
MMYIVRDKDVQGKDDGALDSGLAHSSAETVSHAEKEIVIIPGCSHWVNQVCVMVFATGLPETVRLTCCCCLGLPGQGERSDCAFHSPVDWAY